MNNTTAPSDAGLLRAELSVLYEISSMSFGEDEQAVLRDIADKAMRLFPVWGVALVYGMPAWRRVLGYWGYPSEREVFRSLEQDAAHRFVFEMAHAEHPCLLLMEQHHDLSPRERRLYTLYAWRSAHALQATWGVIQRREAEKELRRHREHLEELVRERTSELNTSNEQLRLEIQERRKAEQERGELHQRMTEAKERELMERTNRLASMGLLAAGLAHEVNNPLQGMMSHLNAVRKALPNDFPRQDSIAMVDQGIQSIAQLIRKMLALSREPSQSTETANCAEALDFALALLEQQFKKSRITIIRKGDRPDVLLGITQRDLIQVLLNLFINARDAMPDGGRLTVTVEQHDDAARLILADNGKGIPAKIAGQIFSPFFTTKGARGTGLGLSVSESLIRHSGGKIEVESEAGKGTKFILTIPRAEERQP
jgi:signal transduction histidine kinase